MSASVERNPNQIFIGNLSHRMKQEDVEKEFKRFGTIKEVLVKTGYAFVVELGHNGVDVRGSERRGEGGERDASPNVRR
jgi:RNA recognition motif-containing protein